MQRSLKSRGFRTAQLLVQKCNRSEGQYRDFGLEQSGEDGMNRGSRDAGEVADGGQGESRAAPSQHLRPAPAPPHQVPVGTGMVTGSAPSGAKRRLRPAPTTAEVSYSEDRNLLTRPAWPSPPGQEQDAFTARSSSEMRWEEPKAKEGREKRKEPPPPGCGLASLVPSDMTELRHHP